MWPSMCDFVRLLSRWQSPNQMLDTIGEGNPQAEDRALSILVSLWDPGDSWQVQWGHGASLLGWDQSDFHKPSDDSGGGNSFLPSLKSFKKEGNWTALLKEVQLPFLKLLRLSWHEWLRTYTDSFLTTLCRVGMEWCWPRMGISHIEWVFALPLVPQGSGCCGALPVGSPLQQHVKHGDSAPVVVAIIIIIINLFRKKSNRLKYNSVCLLSKIPSCI